MSKHIETLSQEQRSKRILTFTFTVIAIFYVLPIMLVLINSLKSNSYVNMETFALPNAKSFVGLDNYKTGMTFGNYPFVKSALYSLFITIVSSMLILICTSMAAWYIARVGSLFSRIVYYLCVFSMVVPFQMVMFTLAKTADTLKLNTPWTIPIVYLGFGAGLAVFMFAGFVKNIPLEIEEAAMIDGCSEMKAMWKVMIPMASPGIITVTIFNFMNIWNEYFMALIFANGNDKIRTLSMGLQNMITSMKYTGDWAGLFAGVIIVLVPTLILYLLLSEKIVAGITGGAVKG